MIARPVRVLHILEEFHPTFSGHGEYLKKLLRDMDKSAFSFSVLARDLEGDGPTGRFEDIRIHRIPDHANYRLHFVELVRALIRLRGEYDLIHLNGLVDHFGLLPVLARLLGKKIVMQMVLMGADDPQNFLRVYKLARVRLRMLGWMDGFMAISRALGDSYLAAGMPARKLRLIPDGVELNRFFPVDDDERRRLCVELDLDPDRPRAIFVGTIIPRKGVDRLLEAWRIVQARLPEAELLLVGLDRFDTTHENANDLNDYVARMKAYAETHDLSARFTGLRYDVDLLLKVSDLFAFASRAEGFGNVIVEAMACGLPGVVTPMDGVANETIEEGVNGYIVETVEAMAERILELLADRDLRERIGRDAVRIAGEKFAMTSIAARYAEFYDDLYRTDGTA